ncbi:MAG: hypothetical protein AAB393_10700, partial [Bacteroidota bacterium]
AQPRGLAGYTVERKELKARDWATIATVKGPDSVAAFASALRRAARLLPHLPVPAQEAVSRLWERAAKFGRLDSLGYWGTLPHVQVALGGMLVDTTCNIGTGYEYRVTQILVDGKGGRSMRSRPVRVPGPPMVGMLRLQQAIGGGDGAYLQWFLVGDTPPAALIAFRSTASGDFERVNLPVGMQRTGDTTFVAIRDTGSAEFAVSRYYIFPIDLFGNAGLKSETALVAGYDFATAALVQDFRAESMDSLGGVRLQWSVAQPEFIRSIQIHRSTTWEKGFDQIAEVPPTDNEYVDQSAKPMQEYFYRIIAVGLLGETSQPSARVYGMFKSSQPPLPPSDLRAEPLRNGVRLRWQSQDEFTKGYYVYRTSGQSDSLEELTALIPNTGREIVFVDSSKSLLGRNVYAYAVKSENTSHVLSGFSDTVFVRPLIPTKAIAPLDLMHSVEGREIRIYWRDMTELDEAIQGYYIFRRELPAGKGKVPEFRKLTDSVLTFNYFADTTVQEGRKYQYAVQSVDFFGGVSRLTETSRLEIAAPGLVPPSGLKAFVTPAGISLRWDAAAQENIASCRLYRYERGKKAVKLVEVKPGIMEWTDKKAERGKLYFYYVTTLNNRNAESIPGDEVSARR